MTTSPNEPAPKRYIPARKNIGKMWRRMQEFMHGKTVGYWDTVKQGKDDMENEGGKSG